MFSRLIEKRWLVVFLLTTLYMILNFWYTFYLTDYQSLLWGDMKQFWVRAENHLNGDIFSVNQWSVWPVLYHILLAGQMAVADFFGFEGKRLEWVLSFGIILNSVGVFCIYFITEKIAERCMRQKRLVAAIAGFLYAVSFPHIHLNAYILSESYAYPAMMFSFYLVICHWQKTWCLVLSGLLFGFSSIVRPALGLLGLVYIFLLFVNSRGMIHWIKLSLSFTTPFLLMVLAGSLLTGFISGGKLIKPGGNGAIVFYIHHCNPNVWMIANPVFLKKGESFNNCKPYQLSRPPYSDMTKVKGLNLDDFKGCNGMIYGQPPALMLMSDREELSSQFHSAVPWNSSYYWRKGIQCIERDGLVEHFIEHTKMFSNIFMFLFYPDNEFRDSKGKFTKSGTNLYLLLSLWVDIFLFMGLLSSFFLRRNKRVISKELAVFSGVPFLVLLTSYIFAIDGRYLVPSLFVGYIVFAFYIVDSISKRRSGLL